MEAQIRTLFALMMREMATRFGRTSAGFAWALIEPVGYVALLSTLFIFMSRSPPLGPSFPLFYASGFLPYYIFRNISAVTAASVRYNQSLLTYPNVTPTDTVLARFLLQFLTNSVIAVVVLAGALMISGYAPKLSVEVIVAAVLLASILGLGVGALNAVLFHVSPAWERVYLILTHPLFIVSGIFYVPELLPPEMRAVIHWNPVVHPVSLMRTGVYANYEGADIDLAYVGLVSVLTLLLGLFFLRAYRARLTEQ
ncbi:MAG: ABC transporter permease [Pseudomonadota bacterium]